MPARVLDSRLPEIIAALPAAVREAAQAGAELVAEDARQRVPVKTGRLRDAIHTQNQPDGVAVIAGDREAFYGHIVEHGSISAAPHPFLVPALEENRVAIVALMQEAIRKTAS